MEREKGLERESGEREKGLERVRGDDRVFKGAKKIDVWGRGVVERDDRCDRERGRDKVRVIDNVNFTRVNRRDVSVAIRGKRVDDFRVGGEV